MEKYKFWNLLDENNNQVVSRCGKITPENPRGDCNPLIESFNIRDGAGAEKILTIHGKRLIHPDADGTKCNVPSTGKYLDHRVKFTDVNGNWVAPLFGDYISWTDTKIVVKIPTVGFVGDGNIKTQFKLDEYAATGKIQVCIHSTDKKLCDCNDISGGKDDEGNETQEELYVPFSTYSRDDKGWGTPNPCEETFHARLFSFDEGKEIMFNISSLPTDYQNAFIRALNIWRCATLINFGIDNNNGIKVDFNFLSAGLYGVTMFNTGWCNDMTNGDQNVGWPTSISFDQNSFLLGLFNPNEPQNGDPINQIYFEYTALHEIGHSIGLIHTVNDGDLMRTTQSPWDYLTYIPLDDIEGGLYCKGRSTNPIAECGVELETLAPGECSIPEIKVGTENHITHSQFLVYPNPTFDIFYVDISFAHPEIVNIEIYDTSGEIVLTKKGNSNQIIPVSFRKFTKGVYFMKIVSNSSFLTKKIIKL